MTKERLEMLYTYLKANDCPILLEDVSIDIFSKDIILDADCDISLLTGYYEGVNYVAPAWYYQLIEKSKNSIPVLVISGMDKISMDEQLKFKEILKYKKVSTFYLPKNCIIIVTCSKLDENKINADIYSLLAHI